MGLRKIRKEKSKSPVLRLRKHFRSKSHDCESHDHSHGDQPATNQDAVSDVAASGEDTSVKRPSRSFFRFLHGHHRNGASSKTRDSTSRNIPPSPEKPHPQRSRHSFIEKLLTSPKAASRHKRPRSFRDALTRHPAEIYDGGHGEYINTSSPSPEATAYPSVTRPVEVGHAHFHASPHVPSGDFSGQERALVPRSPCRIDPNIFQQHIFHTQETSGNSPVSGDDGGEFRLRDFHSKMAAEAGGVTATTVQQVKKLTNSGSTSRRQESIEKWVNSITPEGEGEKDVIHPQKADVAPAYPAGAEDDLTLGAEARMMRGDRKKPSDAETSSINPETSKTPSTSQAKTETKNNAKNDPSGEPLYNRQMSWRTKLALMGLIHMDSIQSEITVKQYDSVDEVLQDRVGNPEVILSNLGFGTNQSALSSSRRVPERFLKKRSQATGISVKSYLDVNPDLREYVMAKGLDIEEHREEPKVQKTSFMKVARTVTMMKKAANKLRQSTEIFPGMSFARSGSDNSLLLQMNPTEYVAPSGESFNSILHPDNCQFRASQGLYCQSDEDPNAAKKPSKMIGGIFSSLKKRRESLHQLHKEQPLEEEAEPTEGRGHGPSKSAKRLDVPSLANRVPSPLPYCISTGDLEQPTPYASRGRRSPLPYPVSVSPRISPSQSLESQAPLPGIHGDSCRYGDLTLVSSIDNEPKTPVYDEAVFAEIDNPDNQDDNNNDDNGVTPFASRKIPCISVTTSLDKEDDNNKRTVGDAQHVHDQNANEVYEYANEMYEYAEHLSHLGKNAVCDKINPNQIESTIYRPCDISENSKSNTLQTTNQRNRINQKEQKMSHSKLPHVPVRRSGSPTKFPQQSPGGSTCQEPLSASQLLKPSLAEMGIVQQSFELEEILSGDTTQDDWSAPSRERNVSDKGLLHRGSSLQSDSSGFAESLDPQDPDQYGHKVSISRPGLIAQFRKEFHADGRNSEGGSKNSSSELSASTDTYPETVIAMAGYNNLRSSDVIHMFESPPEHRTEKFVTHGPKTLSTDTENDIFNLHERRPKNISTIHSEPKIGQLVQFEVDINDDPSALGDNRGYKKTPYPREQDPWAALGNDDDKASALSSFADFLTAQGDVDIDQDDHELSDLQDLDPVQAQPHTKDSQGNWPRASRNPGAAKDLGELLSRQMNDPERDDSVVYIKYITPVDTSDTSSDEETTEKSTQETESEQADDNEQYGKVHVDPQPQDLLSSSVDTVGDFPSGDFPGTCEHGEDGLGESSTSSTVSVLARGVLAAGFKVITANPQPETGYTSNKDANQPEMGHQHAENNDSTSANGDRSCVIVDEHTVPKSHPANEDLMFESGPANQMCTSKSQTANQHPVSKSKSETVLEDTVIVEEKVKKRKKSKKSEMPSTIMALARTTVASTFELSKMDPKIPTAPDPSLNDTVNDVGSTETEVESMRRDLPPVQSELPHLMGSVEDENLEDMPSSDSVCYDTNRPSFLSTDYDTLMMLVSSANEEEGTAGSLEGFDDPHSMHRAFDLMDDDPTIASAPNTQDQVNLYPNDLTDPRVHEVIGDTSLQDKPFRDRSSSLSSSSSSSTSCLSDNTLKEKSILRSQLEKDLLQLQDSPDRPRQRSSWPIEANVDVRYNESPLSSDCDPDQGGYVVQPEWDKTLTTKDMHYLDNMAIALAVPPSVSSGREAYQKQRNSLKLSKRSNSVDLISEMGAEDLAQRAQDDKPESSPISKFMKALLHPRQKNNKAEKQEPGSPLKKSETIATADDLRNRRAKRPAKTGPKLSKPTLLRKRRKNRSKSEPGKIDPDQIQKMSSAPKKKEKGLPQWLRSIIHSPSKSKGDKAKDILSGEEDLPQDQKTSKDPEGKNVIAETEVTVRESESVMLKTDKVYEVSSKDGTDPKHGTISQLAMATLPTPYQGDQGPERAQTPSSVSESSSKWGVTDSDSEDAQDQAPTEGAVATLAAQIVSGVMPATSGKPEKAHVKSQVHVDLKKTESIDIPQLSEMLLILDNGAVKEVQQSSMCNTDQDHIHHHYHSQEAQKGLGKSLDNVFDKQSASSILHEHGRPSDVRNKRHVSELRLSVGEPDEGQPITATPGQSVKSHPVHGSMPLGPMYIPYQGAGSLPRNFRGYSKQPTGYIPLYATPSGYFLSSPVLSMSQSGGGPSLGTLPTGSCPFDSQDSLGDCSIRPSLYNQPLYHGQPHACRECGHPLPGSMASIPQMAAPNAASTTSIPQAAAPDGACQHRILSHIMRQPSMPDLPVEKLLGEAPSWSASHSPGGDTRQHLLNEVKLLQHAVHKYKLEFRALEIRITSDYLAIRDHLSTEELAALDSLTLLRSEIRKELSTMEDLLEARLRAIISGPPEESSALPVDLASLRIIQQMIELLKEQVYHNNIATTIHNAQNPKTPLADLSQDMDAHGDRVAPPNTQTLMHQLSLLQQQIEAQQVTTATVLNSQLKELRDTLVEEIRHSVYAETRQLRLQVQSAETQLSAIKHKVKSSTNSTDCGAACAGNVRASPNLPTDADEATARMTDAPAFTTSQGEPNHQGGYVVDVTGSSRLAVNHGLTLKEEMDAENGRRDNRPDDHGNNNGNPENVSNKDVKTVVVSNEELFV